MIRFRWSSILGRGCLLSRIIADLYRGETHGPSVNYRAVDLPILPGTTLEHPCLAPVAAFAHCAAGVQPRQNWKQIGPSLLPLSCYPCPFPQSVRSFLPVPSAASAVVGRKEAVVADMRRFLSDKWTILFFLVLVAVRLLINQRSPADLVPYRPVETPTLQVRIPDERSAVILAPQAASGSRGEPADPVEREARRLAKKAGVEWSDLDEGDRDALRDFARRTTHPTKVVSTGTGFLVSGDGKMLTNRHVIEGCTMVHARIAGGFVGVTALAKDKENDLALLQIQGAGGPWAILDEAGPRVGEDVIAVGFPLRGILCSSANVARGNVSASTGPYDDARLFQISAPIQPGNSGGPVLDQYGHVIGIVVSKLDAVKLFRLVGQLPENIAF